MGAHHEANADTPQQIQEQHTTPLLSFHKVLNSLNEEVDVLCGRGGGVEDRAEEVREVALRLVVAVHDALLTEAAADVVTVS